MEESVNKKLGKNFFYNFVSQMLSLIVPLITAPYLARVLHENGNGQISFSTSIITYFLMIASLGFDIYGQKKIAFAKDNIEEKSKVFWEITILKTICTLLSIGALFTIYFYVGFGDGYSELILLLSIQVFCVPFDIQFLYKGDENYRSIALKSILARIISVVCIFAFVRTEDDVWVYALCISASVVIPNIALWFSLRKRIIPIKIHSLNILPHIKPAIIIFLPTVAVLVYTVFDKTMIGLMAQNPDYENGCYEMAYKINSLLLLPITFISSVFISRNSNEFSKTGIPGIKNNLYFAINYGIMIGFPMCVGIVVLSSNMCSWFLGPGYDSVPLLLAIMSIRIFTTCYCEVISNQLFIVVGKEKYVLYGTILAAVVNVSLNIIFIPKYGAVGAAITTAISELSIFLLMFFFLFRNKYLSYKYILLMPIKYIIASAVMFVPIFFLDRVLPYAIWSFFLIVFVGAMVYFAILILLRDRFIWSRIRDVKAFINKLKRSGNN